MASNHIRLANLSQDSTTKELAGKLAGKLAQAPLWTRHFAVSGAKPGGKNPPPQGAAK